MLHFLTKYVVPKYPKFGVNNDRWNLVKNILITKDKTSIDTYIMIIFSL